VDGISLAAGDRVLVKDQASGSANGIYEATTSSWNRALDFNGSFDAVRGTWLRINEGSTNANKWFVLTTANPITIGTTSLTFSESAMGTDLATLLAADSGSSLVGFLQAGTGTVGRTSQAKMRDVVSVKDFGAVGDGTNDDTAEIQAAIDSRTNGGTVYFPQGTYKTTSTLTVDTQFVRLLGDGPRASIIKFAPTANDTCIEFTAGAAMLNHCGMSDMGLFSDDSTYTKVGVEVFDCSMFDMDNVYISGSTVVGSTQFWGGADSIGVKTLGRECSSFRNLLIAADRPLCISQNPNSTIDIDHFNFHNLLLFANDNPCVEIYDGVNLTQVSFSGYQAWVLGTDGLRWIDSTTAGVSTGLTLENVRVEQGTSTSAYIVRIEHNTALQGVRIVSGQGGAERNGFKFRKCENVSIDGFYYTGAAGRTALDVDGTVIGLRFASCFWQEGSTATITGLDLIQRSPKYPVNSALAPNAVYHPTSGARGATFGSALSQETISVANAGTVALSTGNTMSGFLMVTSNEGVCGTFQVMGPNQSVTEISDPSAAYSHTAGTTGVSNIYWSTGSSCYQLQNNRGSSMSYKILLAGSYNSF